MTFYRPDEEELKCCSWDALRRHIAECHKEIDRLQSRCEQIESLHRDAERSASLAFEGDGAILPNFGRVGESKVRLVVRLAEAYRDCHKEIDFLRDVRDSQAAMIGKFNKGEPIKVTENGIDTWFNLPVKTPAGLVPEDRTACEVRSVALPFTSDWCASDGSARAPEAGVSSAGGSLRICLADKPAVDPPPTWVPWPWLPDGEYVVSFADGKWRVRKQIDGWVGMSFQHARQLVGYTSDPAPGRWQVTNGTATWLGE